MRDLLLEYRQAQAAKRHRICGWCGDHFEQLNGGRWRKWCSDACKMRAYRQRKKQRVDDALLTFKTEIEPGPGLLQRFANWFGGDR